MKAKATLPLLATAVAAVAALLGVAIPIAAAAPKPRGPEIHRTRREVTAELKVHGSNGFHLAVTLRDRHRLTLDAAKTHGIFDGRVATYEMRVPQPHGSDAIHARIGRLGRIDARFVRDSVHKETSPGLFCSGPRSTVEEGHYVGTIVFRGEDGYTSVHRSRAPATITSTPPLECEKFTLSRRTHPGIPGLIDARRATTRLIEARHHKAEKQGESISALLGAKVKGRPVRFKGDLLAELNQSGKLTEPLIVFLAEAHRRRGRIKEKSTAAVLFASGKSFRLLEPRRPSRGVVIGPSLPFEGSATFRRESRHVATWTGDLRVELPGFGEVHLAGPGVRAKLCASPDCP